MKDKYAGKHLVREFNQIGILVKDCKEAAKQWAEVFGAGPFVICRHVPINNLKYKGEDATWDQDSAVGQWGPIQVELLQTNDDGPVVHYDTPLCGGKLHHINWVAENLNAETERLEKLGFPMVMECTSQGNTRIRWFDADKLLGCLIEVYEANEDMEQIYDSVRIAHEDWDRKDAIAYIYDGKTNAASDEEIDNPELKDKEYSVHDLHQLCFLYDNCKEAAKKWVETMGVGPALISRHIQIDNLKYMGRETTWDQDSALVQFGPIQFELMQTNDESPAVHFKPGTKGRLHHVNWVVEDLDAETKRLEGLGFPKIWEASSAGDLKICMFNAEKFLGCLFEVYEANDFMDMSYDIIKDGHEDWDGECVISSIYDMSTQSIVTEDD